MGHGGYQAMLLAAFFRRRGLPSSALNCLILISVLLPFIVSCGTPPHKLTPSYEQPIYLSYRQPTVVTACRDVTSSYPSSYGQEFQNALAQDLLNAVRVNEGGLVLFYTTITHSSLNNALPPIILPAIPADAPQPALQPIPKMQPNENPYEYAQKIAQIKKVNQALLDSWQATLRTNHQTLARDQQEMQQKAAWLRSLKFPIDNQGTDILGCIDTANQAFSHYPAYQHELLLASDLVENMWENGLSSLNLLHAHVLVLWHFCGNGDTAQICAQRDSNWKASFLAAGASDVNFYDRASSLALQSQIF